ncbi:MAG: 3-deoxy-7-phosphoheptulonate synthase [Clostridiales bacterium]|jgi:3-deoxy-7-phosphoheptulonate synthase|nr:3-deoxy-7-phosphoheptulonate synthase [Clostridiales bacterium]
MIVIMKPGAGEEQIAPIVEELNRQGMQVQMNEGVGCTVLGVLGDTIVLDREKLELREGVERVMPVQEPYKKANRKFHPDDTVVDVGGFAVGSEALAIIAGPCSVESFEQLSSVARSVKASGAFALRGGAYKPRTSPYAFQGLEKRGIDLLYRVRTEMKMPIVSEIIAPRQVETFELMVDVIQIGTRNMQNFDLLKEVGRTDKPILLKRGMSSTIEEWIMSAEYIMAQGNQNVILCERGIRTFETFTRNSLDLSSIPVVKRMSHLPVLVDPSHATGKAWLVPPMAAAAVAAGADGLLVEVHNDPPNALCDGSQSLTPEQFDSLMARLRALAPVVGRTVGQNRRQEEKVGA